jgi:hypothetical protein
MTDEEVWKKRFWVFALVRIGGLAMVLLGIAIAFTGLLQPGGHRYIGAALIAAGAVDLSVVPVLLKHLWERQA